MFVHMVLMYNVVSQRYYIPMDVPLVGVSYPLLYVFKS
jgi:hypothetical protein